MAGPNKFCSFVQVAPAVVEAVILSHNGVAECGVVGYPDELAGELPTAFVVPKPGSGLTEKDLLDFTAAKVNYLPLTAIFIICQFLILTIKRKPYYVSKNLLLAYVWICHI